MEVAFQSPETWFWTVTLPIYMPKVTVQNFILNSYFQNILEELGLKQPPSHLYFVFSKLSFVLVLATISLHQKQPLGVYRHGLF